RFLADVDRDARAASRRRNPLPRRGGRARGALPDDRDGAGREGGDGSRGGRRAFAGSPTGLGESPQGGGRLGRGSCRIVGASRRRRARRALRARGGGPRRLRRRRAVWSAKELKSEFQI